MQSGSVQLLTPVRVLTGTTLTMLHHHPSTDQIVLPLVWLKQDTFYLLKRRTKTPSPLLIINISTQRGHVQIRLRVRVCILYA